MLNNKRGYGLIVLLIGLAIMMALTVKQWGPQTQGGKPAMVQYIDDGKTAGCMLTRQTLATQIQTMQLSNPGQPPTIERLSAMSMGNCKCPGNGSYTISTDGRVLCNIHK